LLLNNQLLFVFPDQSEPSELSPTLHRMKMEQMHGFSSPPKCVHILQCNGFE